MIGFLKTLLAEPDQQDDPNHRVRVSAASLLIAMARADSEVSESETKIVRQALGKLLSVGDAQVDELLVEARAEVDQSVSLYDFTKILHQQQTKEEKRDLVRLLWSVACADGQIDPQEELLVRKVAGLLYLSQEEFIAAKRSAIDAFSSDSTD